MLQEIAIAQPIALESTSEIKDFSDPLKTAFSEIPNLATNLQPQQILDFLMNTGLFTPLIQPARFIIQLATQNEEDSSFLPSFQSSLHSNEFQSFLSSVVPEKSFQSYLSSNEFQSFLRSVVPGKSPEIENFPQFIKQLVQLWLQIADKFIPDWQRQLTLNLMDYIN